MFDRWSRRKRAVADSEAEAETAPVEESPQGPDETLPEEDLLKKLGLPDPDTLGEGDDFSAFLKKGVPEFLKNRALRRLWLSNPALANLDGLLDYGEDFTDAAKVPAVVTTAYRVGRGFLRDIAPDAPQAEDQRDAVPPAPEIAEVAETAETTPESDINIQPEPDEYKEEEQIFRPRRMSFAGD